MGFEGFGIAVAVLFLLAYIVPHLMRSRQAVVDAPIEERYSEELRLIDYHTRESAGGHGTIFLTERTMTTPTSQASQLRVAARNRSRARARISQRRVNQSRGLFIGGALALLIVLFWVLVGFTRFPAAIAIGATVVGGLYLGGFGYLVTVMAKADDADREVIERASEILSAAKRPRALAFTPTVSAQSRKDTTPSQAATIHDHEVAKPVVEQEAAPAARVRAEAPVRAQAPTRPAASAHTEAPVHAEPAPVTRATARPAAKPTPAARVATPSYTLKPQITKRAVKPYQAPAAAEAAPIYRPTQLNERIGDEVLEAPNVAPQMTGAEEIRTDVLGGGTTLDALLDRRRA
ncbi:MAG: hypothetical protein GX483_07480 [Actinomycetaceae bacterium]|nr:hypothetical protein [Actinomycetaceae bacterium]